MKRVNENLPGCENWEAGETISGCVGLREVKENNREKPCFFTYTFSFEAFVFLSCVHSVFLQ